MKKKYVTPIVTEEGFVANESISACWGVGCNTDAANDYEKSIKNFPSGGHNPYSCGLFDHQFVICDAAGTPVGMKEIKHQYWNELNCEITDETYRNELTAEQIASIKPNQTIYWVTRHGNNVYHHVGTVGTVSEKYPNRS